GMRRQCFFRRGALSQRGRQRLLAFRNGLLTGSVNSVDTVEGFSGPRLSLMELLRQQKGSIEVVDLSLLLRGGGAVRFELDSGAIWAGDELLGEVPVGSKEWSLLACLSGQTDRFVPYRQIKQHVLRESGSRDSTEE